jgi:hypothetical protein
MTTTNQEARYALPEEQACAPFTLAEFCESNPDLDPADVAAVACLDLGEWVTLGGGACAAFRIARVQ